MGTHVPRRGGVEIESEAISYARSTRFERALLSRWTPDTTGYGFPHYIYSYGPERFRRESVRAAVQQWSIGLASRVALVLVADGYASNRLTASQRDDNSMVEDWHYLNAVRLKLRPWGSDSSAWSNAIAVETGGRDDYAIVGGSLAQTFPLGRRAKGRFAASIEGVSEVGAIYSPDFSGDRRTFDSVPIDAGLAIEHRWSPVLWLFADYTLHRDQYFPEVAVDVISLGAARGLGSRAMLDAGARFGTTRQSPDVQGYLGFSLR